MAVAGLEWVVIGIILVVLIMWGPSQIPKIAKAFGQAKREFEKASKEAEGAIQETRQTVEEAVKPFKETVQTVAREASDVETDLLRIARQLGIKTEGKTKEQIVGEIAERLKKTSG